MSKIFLYVLNGGLLESGPRVPFGAIRIAAVHSQKALDRILGWAELDRDGSGRRWIPGRLEARNGDEAMIALGKFIRIAVEKPREARRMDRTHGDLFRTIKGHEIGKSWGEIQDVLLGGILALGDDQELGEELETELPSSGSDAL